MKHISRLHFPRHFHKLISTYCGRRMHTFVLCILSYDYSFPFAQNDIILCFFAFGLLNHFCFNFIIAFDRIYSKKKKKHTILNTLNWFLENLINRMSILFQMKKDNIFWWPLQKWIYWQNFYCMIVIAFTLNWIDGDILNEFLWCFQFEMRVKLKLYWARIEWVSLTVIIHSISICILNGKINFNLKSEWFVQI